jgi:GAF domain-containing protein/HAMP domain-containing protein
MMIHQISKTGQISRLRMFISEIMAKISFAWKMSLIVFVLFLSILGITTSAYSGMKSLRYHLSNIYDFMLIPILAISEADTALADAQYQLGNLKEAGDTELAQGIATIHAENKKAHETIVRYDTQWITTLSPEFTQALREAGKLELQQQEAVALESFHASFDAYTALAEEYLLSVEAGNPDASLADRAQEALQPARASLQALIAINNSFADFSNVEAQAAFRQALLNGVSVLIIGLTISLFLSYLIVVSVTVRLAELTQRASAMQEGNLDQAVSVIGQDEISLLGKTFNSMVEQLKSSFSTLEQRVAERTRNLELAAEVGRTVSQVRALDVMLTDAAELIRTQFDLYYVQVYLANPSQTYLNMQAGTGHVGRELLGHSHRLPYNADSINGRAAVEKRSVVISDTTASATFKPNPLLPDTRSEMAVPLMIGQRVVGVLDMQSENAGSLNQDALAAFEALAGQLAVAIQNANSLAETQQARAEVEAQAQRLTRSNWVDYLDAIHKPEETGFVFEQNKVTPLLENVEVKENALFTPITVTGEPLGRLVVEMEGQSPIARTDELLSAVARQVSQQIENLRLLDSAERYRFEAEEASRRLTREGWKSYAAEAGETLSFVYDLKEVRPLNHNGDREPETTGYVLPLKVHDETIGKLVVQGMEAGDGESLSLATAVAERLGTHIESLRQFEETQRGQIELDKRAHQLAAVAEVSSVSSRELDIQKMLESVVHLTQRKFGLYHAHVFLYNENTQKLQIVACGYQEGDEHEGTHGTTTIAIDQEQSLVARSARNRQPVIVNDVQSEPGWLPNPLLPDTNSELAVPLFMGDTILGVLDVQSDQTDAFTQEDANIYSTLASQISTALQNAQSFAKAQKQADRESQLNMISQKIQSATTVEAVLQIAARELGHTLGAPLTIAQLSLKENANGNGQSGNQ